MNPPKAWKVLPAVLACCVIGVASAKLPAPPQTDEQKAKAEETKAKAAETAKKDGELLTKSQDRAAEHYKKTKGGVTKTSVAAPPQKPQK